MTDKQEFPIAVKRVLKAGNVRHVDLYAGRMIRNGQGAMKFKSASDTSGGVKNAESPDLT